ncbi:MAG: translocation/assembly module TamB domain-containing protein, partial [Bacteroidales bacterium]|nr:translocation/assembly module TamB domain-containing protein [Bacteroidales bacterium]
LPSQMGNIKVNGEGLMRFNMPPSGEMGLNGTYIIEDGTFYFTLRNLISRTFHIQSGSTISWTGDMMDADINLKAVYQVKPSLNTLPASSSMTDSSLYNQRIPVDCIIGLTGDLFNPTIRFGLEMPNVQEESIRTLVYNSIDTTNEAQLNQQMISLLVLNSFSLNTGTNVASSMGLSSYDILANQLNSWLSQISDDFDIGVNYQKGDAISPEQLEVALSTQLFNDRIMVNGNFGVGNYRNSEKTSNIVGDVLVEARITKDGRFRVRAYNKTNTYDLFNDNAPYTQGVGISYRSDFNRMRDIFQRKRNKKVHDENDTVVD